MTANTPRRVFVAYGLVAGIGLPAAAQTSADVRTQLQAAMQQHIERTLIDGAYPKIDLATGQTNMLYPAIAHTMVLRLGAYYVLCVDFRDTSGKPVMADFYLAPGQKGFQVFQVEFGNRSGLEALVKAGTARVWK